jgi:hypothetical protein
MFYTSGHEYKDCLSLAAGPFVSFSVCLLTFSLCGFVREVAPLQTHITVSMIASWFLELYAANPVFPILPKLPHHRYEIVGLRNPRFLWSYTTERR